MVPIYSILFRRRAFVQHFSAYRRKMVHEKFSAIIFVPFALFPLFGLFHIIPVFQTFLESPRGSGVDVGMLTISLLRRSKHLFTLLFPDFWGNPATFNFFGRMPYKEPLVSIGMIPFLLSLLGMRYTWKNPTKIFFAGILAICFLLAVDTPISRLLLHLPIPIISTFIPARIFVLATFSLSVFAAFGFETLQERESWTYLRKISWILLIFSTIVFICTFVIYKYCSSQNILPQKIMTHLMVSKSNT